MTKIIGIDLGTTFSAIASLDDLGNPEVIASIDDNRKITASAVYLKNEKIVVGDRALNHTKDDPKNIITLAKREMENDVEFDTSVGQWVPKKENSKNLTPAQVSSLILKKLTEYTDGVEKAVITVPAMFAEKARQATLQAAKLASIEVIELINEPTAAVLHYASLPGVEVSGRVMIYDLGGGTFDVTIAEVKNKKVDILTSRGDKYLGGKDFDQALLKILDKKYLEVKKAHIDITNAENLKKAEELKKNLSVKEKASIVIEGPEGEASLEVTRDEFEESIQTFIEKTKMLIEEALEASNMNPNRINQTLLVGGSTRVPLVVKSLTKLMGKPPVKGVNVDEAVVSGAAVYAGLKTSNESLSEGQQEKLKQVDLSEVCNFYMGTLAYVETSRGGMTVNSIIIPRDTKLPASVTKSFFTIHDNQTTVECTVTQSEGYEEDKEFVNIIHQEDLKLPPNRPKGQKVDVTYSYDLSGVMHCMFFDVESGEKHEIELTPVSVKDIDKAKQALQNFIIE